MENYFIVNSEVVDYINKHQPIEKTKLGELQKKCYDLAVPIIDIETAKFLEFLLTSKRPMRILELGTAVGFSAILMSQYLQEGGKITTIDRNPRMIEQALKNFNDFSVNDKIEFIEGDIVEVIKTLNEPYDFILLDSAKGQYVNIYDDILRLLNPSGILFVDDIFQNGNIIVDIMTIEKRQRTIHRRMNEFVEKISTEPCMQTSILPLADGVIVSVKKGV